MVVTNYRDAKGAPSLRVSLMQGWVLRLVSVSELNLERAMGIEPTSEAWEACCRRTKTHKLAAFCRF